MSICLPCQAAKNKVVQVAKTVNNIVQGYTNLLITDDEIEELSAERFTICNTCTSRIVLVKVNGIPKYKCGECSCPLDAATRSPGKVCDLNKWIR